MEYINQTAQFHIPEPTALSIGKFDGRHRGHSSLLEELLKEKENGLASVLFTFDIPPQETADEEEAKVLTTNEEKRAVLEAEGVDYLVECPFTDEVRRMEPLPFLEWIVERLNVKCLVAGSDFRFGYRRAGDCRLLREHADRLGYRLRILEKVREEDREISSTAIRREILRAQLAKANRLLGYEYFVRGTVVHGNRLGHTIGIPTINLLPPKEKLLPPNGVYVTRVTIGERWYMGVSNVGCKPTIGGEYPIGVETYLLDFCQDVYGQTVTVSFLQFIRPERKFPSVEALKQQMNSDIACAKHFYA